MERGDVHVHRGMHVLGFWCGSVLPMSVLRLRDLIPALGTAG